MNFPVFYVFLLCYSRQDLRMAVSVGHLVFCPSICPYVYPFNILLQENIDQNLLDQLPWCLVSMLLRGWVLTIFGVTTTISLAPPFGQNVKFDISKFIVQITVKFGEHIHNPKDEPCQFWWLHDLSYSITVRLQCSNPIVPPLAFLWHAPSQQGTNGGGLHIFEKKTEAFIFTVSPKLLWTFKIMLQTKFMIYIQWFSCRSPIQLREQLQHRAEVAFMLHK